MERAMEAERKFQPGKVNELMGILKDVRIKSTDIDTYIKGLIAELNKSENDGDLSVVSKLLADGKDGDSLRVKLETYRMDITVIMSKYRLPAKIPIEITTPNTEDSRAASSWQMAFLGNVPKIAAITILNKFDNDVKTTEAMCIDRLAKEAVATDVVLDRFEPLVRTKSSNLHLGDTYEAYIGLGGYNAAMIPEVSAAGNKLEFKDGLANYTAKATSVGTFTVPIAIQIPKRGGGFEIAKGELKYTVSK